MTLASQIDLRPDELNEYLARQSLSPKTGSYNEIRDFEFQLNVRFFSQIHTNAEFAFSRIIVLIQFNCN